MENYSGWKTKNTDTSASIASSNTTKVVRHRWRTRSRLRTYRLHSQRTHTQPHLKGLHSFVQTDRTRQTQFCVHHFLCSTTSQSSEQLLPNRTALVKPLWPASIEDRRAESSDCCCLCTLSRPLALCSRPCRLPRCCARVLTSRHPCYNAEPPTSPATVGSGRHCGVAFKSPLRPLLYISAAFLVLCTY